MSWRSSPAVPTVPAVTVMRVPRPKDSSHNRCTVPDLIICVSFTGHVLHYHLAGGIVDCARSGAHTGPNEGPFLGIPRPGANGGTAPGTNGSAGERAAACGHHRQHGQSRYHTQNTCRAHEVVLPYLLYDVPHSCFCSRKCPVRSASVIAGCARSPRWGRYVSLNSDAPALPADGDT